jgi:hypothetical protein
MCFFGTSCTLRPSKTLAHLLIAMRYAAKLFEVVGMGATAPGTTPTSSPTTRGWCGARSNRTPSVLPVRLSPILPRSWPREKRVVAFGPVNPSKPFIIELNWSGREPRVRAQPSSSSRFPHRAYGFLRRRQSTRLLQKPSGPSESVSIVSSTCRRSRASRPAFSRLSPALGQLPHEDGGCEYGNRPHQPLQRRLQDVVLDAPALGYHLLDALVYGTGQDHRRR